MLILKQLRVFLLREHSLFIGYWIPERLIPLYHHWIQRERGRLVLMRLSCLLRFRLTIWLSSWLISSLRMVVIEFTRARKVMIFVPSVMKMVIIFQDRIILHGMMWMMILLMMCGRILSPMVQTANIITTLC